jgi:hypothetical protein
LGSYAFIPIKLPFLENTFGTSLSHFFGCLQYPEIFMPLREMLFRAKAGKRVSIPFQ